MESERPQKRSDAQTQCHVPAPSRHPRPIPNVIAAPHPSFPRKRVSPKPRWCSEQRVGRFHNPMARVCGRGMGFGRGVPRPYLADPPFNEPSVRTRPGFHFHHPRSSRLWVTLRSASVGLTLPVGGALATASFAGMTGGGGDNGWGGHLGGA